MIGDVIQPIFAVNDISLIMLSQAIMVRSRSLRILGQIVFVNSAEGYITFPFVGSYLARKGTLEAFTASVHLEYGHEGISTTFMIPGFVATPICDKAQEKDISLF